MTLSLLESARMLSGGHSDCFSRGMLPSEASRFFSERL